MCGIVGYIGPKKVVPVVIEGLRKLEYRGYDSAGIAVVNDGKLEVRRAPGKLRNLEETLQKSPIEGTYGIGHTRWATHGRPTEENAHPHRDCTGQIVVVHNGIIENYLELKEQLQREGHKFVTETDTEIVAHLVEKNSKNAPLEEAVRRSLKELRGIYSLVFMSAKDPHKIVAARMGPPSVIGLGDGEFFVASDIPALLEHTREIFFLADGDIAVLTQQGHPRDILPGRWRHSCAHTTRRLRDGSRRPPGQAPRATRHLGSHHGRKGRLQAFHAERDFRAAARRPRHAARPHFAGYRQDFSGRNANYRTTVPRLSASAHRGLRNELACGPGREIHDRAPGAYASRGRLWQRIPVPRPNSRQQDFDRMHQPIRRNGGHARRSTRSKIERFANAGDLQRDGLDGNSRSRGHHFDPRRPGNWCRLHQSVYVTVDRPAAAGRAF